MLLFLKKKLILLLKLLKYKNKIVFTANSLYLFRMNCWNKKIVSLQMENKNQFYGYFTTVSSIYQEIYNILKPSHKDLSFDILRGMP